MECQRRKVKTIALFYYRYRNGGIERVMSLLMPLWQKQGYRIVLITEEEPSEKDYESQKDIKRYTVCRTEDVEKGIVKHETREKQLLDIIKNEGIDLFIYEAASSPIIANDAMSIKKCGIYSIVCMHELFSIERAVFSDYTYRRIEAFKMFDRVVVLSEIEKEYLAEYGIDAIYIYNPIKSGLNNKVVASRKDIVWVGRFENTQKRYMDVIPIMKEVVKKYPNIRLTMYGEGRSIDKTVLERNIIRHGVQENIVIAGYVKDVEKIYEHARIQLVTSAYESFSLVIYEGKKMGIPLVLYEMPYLEILKNGKGHIAVKYEDYQAAANAIIAILDNEELEERLSIEALESINKMEENELQRMWTDLFKDIETNANVKKSDNQYENTREVFDIITKHQGMALNKYAILWEMYRRQHLENAAIEITKIAKNHHKGIAIYPFGRDGRELELILKDCGMEVALFVDQKASQNDGKIRRFEELTEKELSSNIFIISSGLADIYTEIRETVGKYVSEENLYDLWSIEWMTEMICEGVI